MAQRVPLKTTYQPEKVIEPLYTGGPVSLAENGVVLATSLGEDILITNLSNGDKLGRIEGDGETITALILTPNGSHLITCSRSLTMRIYALSRATDGELLTIEFLKALKPHASPVVTIAVDGTGTLVATGASDGVVKVWNVVMSSSTYTLHGHGGVISALCFFKLNASSLEAGRPKTKSKNKKSQSQEILQDIGDSVERLASGSEDGKVRIWDLAKRKCISILDSHTSVVRALAYDDTASILLSGSRDQTVILWDASTWTQRNTILVLEEVEAAGFLGQSGMIFTGGQSNRLRMWWTNSGDEATELQKNGNEEQGIIQIISHATLPYLLLVHSDQMITLVSTASISDAAPGSRLQPLPILRNISGTHDEVIDLAYVGHSNNYLAVATNLESVRILALSGSKAPTSSDQSSQQRSQYFGADAGQLNGHSDIVICLDVDWSGHWVVTGAKDNTARLWRVDPANERFECYTILTGHAESLGAVALPKAVPQDGSAEHENPIEHPPRFVLTGSQDKTIKRWEISQASSQKPSRATYTRKAHDKDINALDIHHNNTLFASASQDRTVKIWSLEDGEPVGVLRGHKRGVWSIRFAPRSVSNISGESGQTGGGRGYALTGSGDKTLKIWSLSDYSCLRTFEGHTNSVLKVLWIVPPQDGRKHATRTQIASAAGDGLVKVWNAENGELDCTLDNHTDRVWALAASEDCETIISGGGDSVITFWKNTTHSTQAAAAAASTERVEQDQELQNYIRAGSYRSAIVLALQLNHPARLLSLFTSVVNTYPPEAGSLSGLKDVDDVLANLADEQLFILFLRIRDWNANTKSAHVSQKIYWTLLKSYPASRFTHLRPTGGFGKGQNIKDVLDAIKAYTERHYKRIEELIDESYLVDYTLTEMAGFGPLAMQTNGNTVNGHNADVVMFG